MRRFEEAPPFLRHLWSSDGDLFACAWRGERLVGFAAAVVRGKHWYLAWLFVHPAYQGLGIGKELLQRVWWERKGVVHSLCTFGYNMQAVGLYSRFGMAPTAMFTVMEAPVEKIVRSEPTGLDEEVGLGRRDMAWLSGLEREIRGFSHPEEWAFWDADDDFHVLLFRERGRPVGYGMISSFGDVSPIGAVQERFLVPVAAETIRAACEMDLEKLRVICPHPSRSIYPYLLSLGFRNQEMPILMTDGLRPDFTRYVPASLAVF